MALYETLPLTTISYLSLACVSIPKETLKILNNATDRTRSDSCLFLDHLNLSQACTSDVSIFNVSIVHYTDCVIVGGEKLDECFICSNHRQVTICGDGDSILVSAPKIDKIWSFLLTDEPLKTTVAEDVKGKGAKNAQFWAKPYL